MNQAPQSGGGRTTANVNKNTDQLGRLADKATDQARNVAQHVEEFANNAAQQGREAGERIQEVAGNVKGAVDKSIKDQPMATLASPRPLASCLAPCGSHKGSCRRARMLCSRTDRDAVVACLVPGPQMHATKFDGHWVPFEGEASVNQQTIAASDLPRCPRKLLR